VLTGTAGVLLLLVLQALLMCLPCWDPRHLWPAQSLILPAC
jgi:hypothetical protein